MTDSRRLRSIQARYDIEIDRWSFDIRRRRRRLNWLCGLGTLLICVPLLFSDQRVFESRPVSRPHQVFEQNCKHCHDQTWKPLARLAALDNDVRSVSDQACQQCHQQTNLDHLIDSGEQGSLLKIAPPEAQTFIQSTFAEVSCAGCHQEHRGKEFLSNVSDQHCAKCHQAMHAAGIPTPFFQDLTTFDQHPEFAPIREIKDRSAMQRHPSALLARFEEDKLRDNVAFRFNHHLHLDPELRAGGAKSVTLNCQDCHVPDSSGAYFKPIQFESHCQRCHVLGTKATGALPHVSPEIVRGMLLERLATSQSVPAASPSLDTIGGPTKPPVPNTPGAAQSEEWKGIQTELSRLEEILFGASNASNAAGLPPRMNRLEMTCTKCHMTEQIEGERVSWKIIPPQIPGRWYPNSRFDHKAHGAVSCTDCHTRSGEGATSQTREKFYPTLSEKLMDSTSIYASTSAEDVLMPSIQICRECHGESRKQRGVAAARSDCFECHVYHHPTGTAPHSTLLKQILTNATPTKQSTPSVPAGD